MRATIPIESPEAIRALLGIGDRNARLFRAALRATLTVRKGDLLIDGADEDVAAAKAVVDQVLERFRQGGEVDESEVEMLLRAGGRGEALPEARDSIVKSRAGRNVAPRTPAQHVYVDAMRESELVFAIGPAGTGKTYLAVAMAVRMLRDGIVRRLILTRPAVEAGEKLGFLPGTFEAKVNPYLRPLYDALFDLVEPAQIRKFQENDVIEIAPLAYMRGRTLGDAFIILDEGQNTTRAQMKMFLTRMGQGSRMVVTGDVTQIDLPPARLSGLVHAARIMRGIPGIRFCRFGREDIVRHPLVQDIVDAYEQDGQQEEQD